MTCLRRIQMRSGPAWPLSGVSAALPCVIWQTNLGAGHIPDSRAIGTRVPATRFLGPTAARGVFGSSVTRIQMRAPHPTCLSTIMKVSLSHSVRRCPTEILSLRHQIPHLIFRPGRRRQQPGIWHSLCRPCFYFKLTNTADEDR